MNFLKKHKNDILLILALLLLAGGVWLWMRSTRAPGAEVRISADGGLVKVLPLGRDEMLLWHGADGGSNTIVVENGAVRVMEADCPDHICVRRGEIRFAGETIVCLPHRLVIEITGGASGFDGVSG